MALIWGFLPVVLGIALIWFIDSREREPVKAIIVAFTGGMTMTFFGIYPQLFDAITDISDGGDFFRVFMWRFFQLGIIAGICKFIAFFFTAWKQGVFDSSFDGIVYGVTVSMGYCCMENVICVLRDPSRSDIIYRSLLIVPANMAFGIIMGALFTRAKLAGLGGHHLKKFGFLVLALFVPGAIQGLFEASVASGTDIGSFAAFLVTVAMDFAALLIVRHERLNDSSFYFTPADNVIRNLRAFSPPPVKDVVNDVFRNIDGEGKGYVGEMYSQVVLPPRPHKKKKESIVEDTLPDAPVRTAPSEDAAAAPQVTSVSEPAPIRFPEPVIKDDFTWTCPDCGSVNVLSFCGSCGRKKP